MDASQREKLNLLFEQALALPVEARSASVAEACGADAALHDELISLLSAYEASAGYFEALAERIVAPALAAVGGSASSEFSTGEIISHYEILARLGGGGMGVVYQARDLRLDRLVALKFLPPELAADDAARARLVAEAKAASALDHPNIAVVYEIAEPQAGRPFIAMAWYEGETLKERLARGPLPISEALEVAAQLAGALAAAHRAGIIHRDLKPGNVLITGEGVAKLVDFGIAKVTGAELTKEGTTLGTVAYMSPEQTRGEAVDPRTDLWSLGVVLYEMLTGQRPFRAEDEQALIYAIRQDEPAPLVRLRPEVPGELCDIVGACLEKDPERRYAAAEALLADLGALQVEDRRVARPGWQRKRSLPERQRLRHRRLLGGVAAVLFLGLAAGAYLGLRGADRADESLMSQGLLEAAAEVSATSVAVLPFTVRGSPDLTYLREGMVSLLATKLYGAGELRSVDPHALLRRVGEQEGWDPAQASALAAEMGAGLYVLGNVVGRGGRLHLDAVLYDVGAHIPLAQAAVEGSAAELFALVDQLAVELLSTRVRQPGAGLGRAADLTTHSLPALRAFLHGERERRVFNVNAAIEAYGRAIQEDSTFALAHLRLVSLGWVGAGRHLLRPSLDAALRHQQRLSLRDRHFLEAQASLLNSPLEAEPLIRSLTVRYPEDGEGWSLLGELLWHGNPLRGQSRAEAREALERALALDPDFLEPLLHVTDFAVVEGRYADVLALTERWRAGTGGERRPLRMLARYTLGPETERQSVLAELRSAEDVIRRRVFVLAVAFGPPELLRESLDLFRERPFTVTPALGRRMPLLSGRPREAVQHLRNAQPVNHRQRVDLETRIAVLPFLDTSPADLARLRAELLALPANATSEPAAMGPDDFEQERLWLLGALSVRLKELQVAERYARELERQEGTDAYGVAARVRSRSLRALIAREQGQPGEALRLLESVEREMFSLCNWCTGTPRVDFSFERFMRAELLRELEREEEALPFYPTNEFNSHEYSSLLYPLFHFRAGEIHERRGEREKAIHHYTFFTLLWRDAAPELRPLVEQAERRLAALRRGG